MNPLALAFALALALSPISCSHAPKQQPTGLAPKSFWSDQLSRADEAKWLSGKIRMSYQGRKQSVSGKGRLLTQLPAQVRMELRDPLGRTAFLALLEGKSFTAYYPSQKRAVIGNESGNAYFRQSLGLEAGFDELQRLLLGLLPVRAGKGPFPGWDWDMEKGAYVGELKTGDVSWRVFVDGHSGAMKELQITSPRETAIITYADFQPCCEGIGRAGRASVPVASVVQVSLDRAGTSVEVEWEDIEKLDRPKGKDAFQIALPDDVQKISVR